MYYICLPSPPRASVIVKCEMIWSLMRGFASGGPEVAALPPRAQRDLVCSLVRCAVRESRQPFLSQVIFSTIQSNYAIVRQRVVRGFRNAN